MANTLSIKLRRDQLAEKIGGGVPKSSIFLIEGKDGGGKSILCQRLTYGFLKNSATVTYISTELSTMGFVTQMGSLGYEVVENILNEELLMIPMFPTMGNVRLRKNFIDRMMKTNKIFENDVIIFDALSYLIIQDDFTQEKIFSIVKFFKQLTSLGKIVIISVDPTLITESFLKIIRTISDIYVTVEAKSILGNILNVISINRFRGQEKKVTIQFPFSVRPGSGLSIEIAALS